MSAPKEECQGMSRNELEKEFINLNKSIETMSDLLEKIDERQQLHYNDLIKVEKDVEYIAKEIRENKSEQEKEITTLWDELRRRDRKTMWTIGMVVPVVAAIISLVVGFFAK